MSPRPTVGPRLERVLALVPFLAANPGVTLDEVATRFGVAARELERDLEFLPFCGLPPYSPDRLIDVEITDDGSIRIRFAEYFERPLQLTTDEGFALLSAGRALLAVPGSDPSGPLASALEKLAAVVGSGEGLEVDFAASDLLVPLRDAIARGNCVEIDYYSAGRDASSTRVIEPALVFHAFGHWYLDAYCRVAGDERLFRVDRVLSVRPTGEHFEPAASRSGATTPELGVFHPAASDDRVTLRLLPSADWVIDTYPTESVTREPDGSSVVVLAVSGQVWLERLLLRLGGAAEILDPPEYRGRQATAARRVLARYAVAHE